jgi:hypothetical protein
MPANRAGVGQAGARGGGSRSDGARGERGAPDPALAAAQAGAAARRPAVGRRRRPPARPPVRRPGPPGGPASLALPALGPRPPLISRLYVAMAKPVSAAQSTPCGTLTVLTVISLRGSGFGGGVLAGAGRRAAPRACV